MSKKSYFLMSFIAAVPAGFLCYQMVQVFLNHADQTEQTLLIVVGITLAISAIVALSPIGILLFSPRLATTATPSASPGSSSHSTSSSTGMDDFDDPDDFESAGFEEDDDFEDDDDFVDFDDF